MRINLIILSTLLTTAAIAQTQEPKQLSDEEINVVKAYKPVLSEASRINTLPQGDTSKLKVEPQQYSIPVNTVDAKPDIQPIKPVRIKDDNIAKLYHTYARAGFGNYTTPYAEVWVNSLRLKDFQAGVHAKHLSSSGAITGRGYSGYSQNVIDGYIKRFYNTEVIAANLGFDRKVSHFYGYDPDVFTNLNKNNTKQLFHDFNATLSLYDNTGGKKQLDHHVNVNYYYFGDNYDAVENSFITDFDVKKKFGFGTLAVLGTVDYVNNTQPFKAGIVDRSLISIAPMYNNKFSNFTVDAGFRVAFEGGAISGTQVYPIIKAEANIADNFAILYAGFDGNVKLNKLKGLALENQFINTLVDYKNTSYYLGTAGIRGSFSHTTTYNAGVDYKIADNTALFVLDTNNIAGNTFTVIYDKVTSINVHAEVGHNFGEKWRLVTRADYTDYKTTNELKAWYMPPFKLMLGTVYNMGNKIYLKGDVFATTTRYYKSFTPTVTAKSLAGWIDANIGVEYRYSRVFSFFLDINNIAAVRYEKWQNYYTQRFNALGGLTYSF